MAAQRLLVNGFHGTTNVAADEIVANQVFIHDERDWHWLGRGVYFWQDAPLRAWDWGIQKALDDQRRVPRNPPFSPAVVTVTLDITECVDLLDIERMGVIREAWNIARSARLVQLPRQIGPHEALRPETSIERFTAWLMGIRRRRYGNNCSDFHVMNAAVRLLRDRRLPCQVVRAAFMEGSPVYPGSWFLDRSHVQVAVVDPRELPSVLVGPITKVPSTELEARYNAATAHYRSSWNRKMRPL